MWFTNYRCIFKVGFIFFLLFLTFSHALDANTNCCKWQKYCEAGAFGSRWFECCSPSVDWCKYSNMRMKADYYMAYVPGYCPPQYTNCFSWEETGICENSQGNPVTRRWYQWHRVVCDDTDDDGYAVCGIEWMWSKDPGWPNYTCTSSMCDTKWCP